ncbi:MAG: tol-pal system protein YbgF [Acidobacteria bacterium]|nr:MAG: tol-pal system protein YbgF [Acidobacteriota bacterium]
MKRVILPCVLAVLAARSIPAQGGTKEEIQRLQSDVLALQNQMRLLDKNVTEGMNSLKTLASQLTDQVGKSNQILSQMSSTLEKQASGAKFTNESLLQEVRNLGAKIDDAGTRISALAQQISEMKTQAKEITPRRFQSPGGDSGPLAMSSDTIFYQAYNDLVQGNLDLAIQGFTSFVTNFPASEKADDAQYYIGEAYYNDNKLPQAVAAFTKVVNDFPKGDKVASALYKRALAELAMKEKDNAIEDFKVVVQKFSSSPEAALAKSQLDGLGVDLSKPSKVGSARRKP